MYYIKVYYTLCNVYITVCAALPKEYERIGRAFRNLSTVFNSSKYPGEDARRQGGRKQVEKKGGDGGGGTEDMSYT